MSQDNDKMLTKRVVSPQLEGILYEPISVLDHGFIRVIDYMGDDSSIVQAARVSYGSGTKQINQDRGLINYLMRHSHTTPFEMCEIKLHIKLPIFIARQWIRHRTANVNEYSARYSILDKEFYLPSAENIAIQSSTNKQCREENSLSEADAQRVLQILKNDAEHCYASYLSLLGAESDGQTSDDIEKVGIARELARMNLTLNYYTQWYWKIDLHNLLHFLKLRIHPHAQLEIRLYAEKILDIVKLWTPIAYEAFVQYVLNAHTFSGAEMVILRKMISGESHEDEKNSLSKREWKEFLNAINQPE